ncbi:nuclear transport factor 2 family protein [Nitrospiraceae bacterium AH_259_D15_M11_P09]|nr:nuclear transport factor 2 family protein [Nitrospiraceae bacterium AH_259_D15_M11_P09]
MSVIRVASLCLLTLLTCLGGSAFAAEGRSPEEVLRTLVRANAEKDLATMSKLMAHDKDTISYTIGGRKYVGWTALARDMQGEFDSVSRLEMPIHELTVWTRGNIAWFAMELDYIRYVGDGNNQRRIVLPLRETGVLEQRHGNWVLVAWHESSRLARGGMPEGTGISTSLTQGIDGTVGPSDRPNLSGEWEIHEEDKSYTATLDRLGNGTYTWQGGQIGTTLFADRKWQGTWHQTGNDREGGFEVLLSEDGEEAKGVWWYTRVGDKTNIPPRQWGGTYLWKRLTPVAKPIKGN